MIDTWAFLEACCGPNTTLYHDEEDVKVFNLSLIVFEKKIADTNFWQVKRILDSYK